MLTSTYFAFFIFSNGLNERPIKKVENEMSAPALIQIITALKVRLK